MFDRSGASAERCGELKFVAVLVPQSGRLPDVRVELDPVLVPHGQLPLPVATVRAAGAGVPGPDLVRVEQVQLPFEPATVEGGRVADAVAVNIVRVVLVFGERSVDEDLRHADGLKLLDDDRELFDEVRPPLDVPVRVRCSGTLDEERRTQLSQDELVVTGGQQAVFVERGQGKHRASLSERSEGDCNTSVQLVDRVQSSA